MNLNQSEFAEESQEYALRLLARNPFRRNVNKVPAGTVSRRTDKHASSLQHSKFVHRELPASTALVSLTVTPSSPAGFKHKPGQPVACDPEALTQGKESQAAKANIEGRFKPTIAQRLSCNYAHEHKQQNGGPPLAGRPSTLRSISLDLGGKLLQIPRAGGET
jgi:hypothetical protein